MQKSLNVMSLLVPLVLVVSSPETCQAQKPKAQAQPAPQAESKKPTYTKKEIPQGKLENLVAKVGPGGITKADYDFYLLKLANKSRKTVEALSDEERKAALNVGIDDELVFQSALADGALKDEYTCWTIIEEYKSQNVTAKIDPQSFTEDELRAFYKSRPDIFKTPPTVQARGLKLGSVSDQEAAKIQKQVAAKPDSRNDWIDLGWFKEGDSPGGMPPAMTAQIFKLKKGQVSAVISEKYTGDKFIFQVTDRKEPELPPFEDVKGKVRFEYIAVKSAELKKGMAGSLPKGEKGVSEEQAILDTAISEGYHRNLIIRNRIIQYYLAKKKMKIEQLAPELRKKYKVEIIGTP